MEVYHQILAQYLAISGCFEDMIDAPAIVEGICYRTLCSIREILNDPISTDSDCFQKIEQIVQLYESIGSDGGGRHDFG